MPTYHRETRVEAPFEEVWDFHLRVSGLAAVTPAWMNLRVERVVGPDGDEGPEVLEEGTVVRMSIRPFGVGPRVRWASRIVAREEGDRRATFRDAMVEGPFDRWEHTHRFFAEGDDTVVVDTVDYRLGDGLFGAASAPFSYAGLEGLFRDRHRRMREALERRR